MDNKRRTATVAQSLLKFVWESARSTCCRRGRCNAKAFECMLIKGAMSKSPIFGLSEKASREVAKPIRGAHRFLSAVSAEICGGSGPVKSLL